MSAPPSAYRLLPDNTRDTPWHDIRVSSADVQKVWRGTSETTSRAKFDWVTIRSIHEELRLSNPEFSKNELIKETQQAFQDKFIKSHKAALRLSAKSPGGFRVIFPGPIVGFASDIMQPLYDPIPAHCVGLWSGKRSAGKFDQVSLFSRRLQELTPMTHQVNGRLWRFDVSGSFREIVIGRHHQESV